MDLARQQSRPACACSNWGAPRDAQVAFAGHIPDCCPKSLWLESACCVGGTYSYRCVWWRWVEQNCSSGVQSELSWTRAFQFWAEWQKLPVRTGRSALLKSLVVVHWVGLCTLLSVRYGLEVASFSRGSPDSIPGQSVWHLWWTRWHCDRFLSQYFSFPLSVPFHQCSIPIHSPTTHAI